MSQPHHIMGVIPLVVPVLSTDSSRIPYMQKPAVNESINSLDRLLIHSQITSIIDLKPY